jgi:PleD family two-component response regulator
VVVLWEQKSERTTANPVLARIAKNLAQNPVQLARSASIRLSFSAGVVRCTGSEDADLGVDSVLALADDALYEAKEEGDGNTFHQCLLRVLPPDRG